MNNKEEYKRLVRLLEKTSDPTKREAVIDEIMLIEKNIKNIIYQVNGDKHRSTIAVEQENRYKMRTLYGSAYKKDGSSPSAKRKKVYIHDKYGAHISYANNSDTIKYDKLKIKKVKIKGIVVIPVDKSVYANKVHK